MHSLEGVRVLATETPSLCQKERYQDTKTALICPLILTFCNDQL